ncbi:PepSY domain-containing protein [Pontibacter sp. BT310]|uniref:PepSY domain-containing protein n=1 Tax=Pontibacter populi TaxID=890055 RepID=A0ABS6XE50_9BACT|nr:MULTISPECIES: PepSY-associated TM helix domain-containing protein [Pontibacter]MBJ6118954.1 PepSY domain-containing protein [Pontibacter sp. BT310]MBR0571382.1 PepSY domain-containing protein [Microvirga sp. STS03]MBW3365808.1 PepSY domain-containing protein [Pontibacter populi]
MRKLILQLHLWVGLTAGAILSIVGITGSVYVFQPELTALLYSELYQSADPDAKVIDGRTIVAKAEAQFGGEVSTILFPLRELENYIVKVEGKKEFVFYDGATGAYLGEMAKRRGILEDVLEIHRQLTLGEIGSTVTGIASLLLVIVLLSSGLYLWLPHKKKQLKEGLRFKPNASFKRRNYDVHKVFGFYFIIPLFLVSITGVYFAFPEKVQAVVDFVTRTEEPTPDVKKIKSTYRTDLPEVTIVQALDMMDTMYPGYHKRNLIMPKDSADRVYFSVVNAAEVDAGPEYRPQVYIDQYTGKILFAYEPHTAQAGHQLTRNWFVPIHFGEIGGWFTRILWFITGLMPAVLWVSGIIIWRNRTSKNKKSKSVVMVKPFSR